jgi:hypothetical protein
MSAADPGGRTRRRETPVKAPRRCIGFGDKTGTCQNVAGTPWTHLWCAECDEARRTHITASLESLIRDAERRAGSPRGADPA